MGEAAGGTGAWVWYLAIAGASAFAAWLATGALLRLLHRYAVLDHPNPRSSHTRPTPRGGGLAVVATIGLAWLMIWGVFETPFVPLIVLLAVGLAALSWLDDLKGLPVAIRLLAHAVAVVIGLMALPSDGLVFQGLLPVTLDRAATALVWLWFVNLYNFMDGIDGIAGVETVAIGAGVFAVAVAGGLGGDHAALALGVAGATLGFLVWNWHPARIFLGDAGSVPLGFLTAWLLVTLAASGLWLPALLLPLYFLADATLTLARRLVAGERVWQAHASHFYQIAARRLESHAQVAGAVAAANMVLIIAALATVLAEDLVWPGAILGGAACVGLLWYLGRRDPGAAAAQSSDES